MFKQFDVRDVKCTDDGEGVDISCGPGIIVTLIFDKSVSRELKRELARLLQSNMRLAEVIVQAP